MKKSFHFNQSSARPSIEIGMERTSQWTRSWNLAKKSLSCLWFPSLLKSIERGRGKALSPLLLLWLSMENWSACSAHLCSNKEQESYSILVVKERRPTVSISAINSSYIKMIDYRKPWRIRSLLRGPRHPPPWYFSLQKGYKRTRPQPLDYLKKWEMRNRI